MKVIIIEDEKPAVDSLLRLLEEVAPDFKVASVLDEVNQSVLWLTQNEADLIFLDIHLGDDLSFRIFEQISIHTPVIFTTAYDQYALRAFRQNSIDYLLKPIHKEELEHAIRKFRELRQAPVWDLPRLLESYRARPNWQERFMVVSGQKIQSVPVERVAYFISEGRYSRLVTQDGKRFLLDQSLESLESKLDPDLFFRASRKAILTHKGIGKMLVWEKGRIKIDLQPPAEDEIIVSVERASEFKKWAGK